ncbi:MAG: FMN-binding protein [Pseudomonadota bacterium]
MIIRTLLLLGLLSVGSQVWAIGIYQQPVDFIAKTFANHPPEPKALFLRGETKKQVKDILGHRYSKLRIRYWLDGKRSVWVLDEIGKERPITAGIVVNKQKIERIKVLIFRESRGWEVRHDFFTEQFIDSALNSRFNLDRQIDGITGATLSVRAVTRLARVALYLHSQILN